MGRQSPIQLKCHCVLKTGATDIFCFLNGVHVVIQLPCTKREHFFVFHSSAFYFLRVLQSYGSEAGLSLLSNLVLTDWFWVILSVQAASPIQQAPLVSNVSLITCSPRLK